jgi:16S rRNA (cytosine1402-N4)-methyltransferase
LSGSGRLISIDQDEEAIEAASQRLKEYGDRVTIIRDNYRNIKNILNDLGIREVNGIILDIGVSSHQLDEAGRGFSYMKDGPLDMRMDRSQALTAADIVNGYQEEELVRIIKTYGEERYAKLISGAIIRERKKKAIETTLELSDIIGSAVPAKARHSGGNPAMRTFQALRIEVNHELDALSESLDLMIDLLTSKGRLSVITFHSLEDRIVKESFRRNENPCICPPDFPVCVCGRKSRGRCAGRKAVTASEEEIKENPRAHSAKLRTFEKT